MGMTREEIESCIQTLRFLENTFLDDHGIFLNDKHPDNIEKIITFLHESSKPKTAHWTKVTNGRGGHECDVCHDYAPSFQSGNEYLSAFCPNCGADMRESEE